METFEKQPSERLDYLVDMTGFFEEVSGDYISSVVLSATPAFEVGDTPTHELIGAQPTSFKVWLSGGDDGTTYKITAEVTTNAGREKEIDFKLKVKDL